MTQQPSKSGAFVPGRQSDEGSEQLNLMMSSATDNQATHHSYPMPADTLHAFTRSALYPQENYNLLPSSEEKINLFDEWSGYNRGYSHENASAEAFQYPAPTYASTQPAQTNFSTFGFDELHPGTNSFSFPSEHLHSEVYSSPYMSQLVENSQSSYLTVSPSWLNITEPTPFGDPVFVPLAADNIWQVTNPQIGPLQAPALINETITVGSQAPNALRVHAILPIPPHQSLDLASPVNCFAFDNSSLPTLGEFNQSIHYDGTTQGAFSTPVGQSTMECLTNPSEAGILPPAPTEPYFFGSGWDKLTEQNMGHHLNHEHHPRIGLLSRDNDNSQVVAGLNDLPTRTGRKNTLVQRIHVNTPATTFGPSRKFSLPPARRGGRKGPLSSEALQKRRQAMMHGVCIRCRKMKIECSGELPCKACHENSRASRWKYPCVIACFLEIVKRSSYNLGTFYFQTEILEKNDAYFITNLFAEVNKLGQSHRQSRFRMGWPGILEVHGMIFWDKAAKLLMDFFEHFQISGHIAKLPNLIVESKLMLSSLMAYSARPLLLDTSLLWQHHFHPSRFKYKMLAKEDSFVDSHERIIDIFMWIFQRCEEIALFRALQDAANELNSTSPRGFSVKAEVFMAILLFGFNGEYDMSSMIRNGNDRDKQATTRNFLDQSNRVRSALFVYLRIMLDKLPAWCDFWQYSGYGNLKILLEVLKNGIISLEYFDVQSKEVLPVISEYHNRWATCPSYSALNKYKPEQAKNDSDDNNSSISVHSRATVNSVYDYGRDIEDEVDRLTNYYEPRVRGIMLVLEQFMEIAPPLSELRDLMGDMLSVLEMIRQGLKDVSKRLTQEGGGLIDFGTSMARAVNFTNVLDVVFAEVLRKVKILQDRLMGTVAPESVYSA